MLSVIGFLGVLCVAFVIIVLFISRVFPCLNIISFAGIKGKMGELGVSLRLNLLPNNYRRIDDLLIQHNGHSTQIDHVVISEFGIIVIETKNYSGWIFGSDDSEYWVKNQYGRKYRFYNPIRQNESHVNALKNILGLHPCKFIPIVVFHNKATLKVKTQKTVVYASRLNSTIRSYTTPLLTSEEKDYIYGQLLALNITDPQKRRTHKSAVKNNIRRKNETVKRGRCPRCGGTLVLRKGKYGRFWGCSNYPKCRYIQN